MLPRSIRLALRHIRRKKSIQRRSKVDSVGDGQPQSSTDNSFWSSASVSNHRREAKGNHVVEIPGLYNQVNNRRLNLHGVGNNQLDIAKANSFSRHGFLNDPVNRELLSGLSQESRGGI